MDLAASMDYREVVLHQLDLPTSQPPGKVSLCLQPDQRIMVGADRELVVMSVEVSAEPNGHGPDNRQ
jgi:hypothetical protein